MARKIQVVHTYRAQMVHLDLDGVTPVRDDDGSPIVDEVDVNLSWPVKVSQQMQHRSHTVNKLVAARATQQLNEGMRVRRAFMLGKVTHVGKRSRPA